MSDVRGLWRALSRIKGRDLVLVFAGLFCLIVIVSLATHKIGSARKQKDLAHQQALDAQRLQAEQQRREATEAQERQRRDQLELLKHAGIRSVELSAAATDPLREVGVWLEVHSDPEHAEVFLNWSSKGRTPLWLHGVDIAGFLVVTLDGYRPWFGDITHKESGQRAVRLRAEEPYPQTRLLLVMTESTPPDTFYVLRSELIAHGFTVPEQSDATEFARMAGAAGGHSPALHAWARAQFNTRMLVRARMHESNRKLGEQSPALTGTVRSLVNLNLDLYDLTSGAQQTTITATGSAFALDQPKSLHDAQTKAAKDAAGKLRTWLDGHYTKTEK
jgi:hypothetical protein